MILCSQVCIDYGEEKTYKTKEKQRKYNIIIRNKMVQWDGIK